MQCDELRPQCSLCIKSRRLCRYTHGSFLRFVAEHPTFGPGPDASSGKSSSPNSRSGSKSTEVIVTSRLVLKSAHAPASGTGMFQNFASVPIDPIFPRREKKKSTFPSTETTVPRSMSTRISMMEADLGSPLLTLIRQDSDSPLNLFGDFIRWIPTFIEKSDVIFVAVTSLLDSFVTYRTRNDENLNRSRRSNGRALRCIRSELQGDQSRPPSSEVLLAIRIMFLIEVTFLSSLAGRTVSYGILNSWS